MSGVLEYSIQAQVSIITSCNSASNLEAVLYVHTKELLHVLSILVFFQTILQDHDLSRALTNLMSFLAV